METGEFVKFDDDIEIWNEFKISTKLVKLFNFNLIIELPYIITDKKQLGLFVIVAGKALLRHE